MAERLIDELVPTDLHTLIKGVGLAVAEANQALSKIKYPAPVPPAGGGAVPALIEPVVFTIPEAEVEMKMSLMQKRDITGSFQAGGGIFGFNVTAGFSATFGYHAEASTRILIKFKAVPAS